MDFRPARLYDPSRLFREATQLKTVGAIVCVARADVLRVKVQKRTETPTASRRPTIPVVAAAQDCTLVVAAVARGGAAGTPTKPPDKT